MTLKSMTGFARADDSLEGISWHWEARTVNGRGLDVRIRVPGGYEALEGKVREACASRLVRGNCAISLNVKRETALSEVKLNQQVLTQVLAAAEAVRARTNAAPPAVEGLLAIKGVLEVVEASESEAAAEARAAAMLRSLNAVLDGVAEARSQEGARLARVVGEQVARIEALTRAAQASPARSVETIKARIKEQVARLLDAVPLDEARLYQEAALLAQRSDIEEELARLFAHVAAARDLLVSPEAVGRKLDFLSQEFNREANTLCSKANDPELTRIGLELKAVIDQLREQVQNIE